MWSETTRRQYRREDLRYANDMTEVEWALIEPHLPAPKRLGRPRCVPLRAVVEALLHLLRPASPWRLLPHDFPKRSTVQRYFYAWQAAGVWYDRKRGPAGYDAGKKIAGRKRHIITDAAGHLMAARVHAADIQDRDGASDLLRSIRYLFPWLRHVFADGGYAGMKIFLTSDLPLT